MSAASNVRAELRPGEEWRTAQSCKLSGCLQTARGKVSSSGPVEPLVFGLQQQRDCEASSGIIQHMLHHATLKDPKSGCLCTACVILKLKINVICFLFLDFNKDIYYQCDTYVYNIKYQYISHFLLKCIYAMIRQRSRQLYVVGMWRSWCNKGYAGVSRVLRPWLRLTVTSQTLNDHAGYTMKFCLYCRN